MVSTPLVQKRNPKAVSRESQFLSEPDNSIVAFAKHGLVYCHQFQCVKKPAQGRAEGT
jgi:hypothetical protein